MSKARDDYMQEVEGIMHDVEVKAQNRFPGREVYLEDSYDSFETKVIVIRSDDNEIEDALAEFCIEMDEECEYLTFIPRIRRKRCQTTTDNATME